MPHAVSTVVEYFDAHPEVMMVYGEGYLINENGRIKSRFTASEPFNLWRLIHYRDYILQQTVFVRKVVFDAVGMLDERLHYGMDWDLWIRVGQRFNVAFVPEYLASLREHASAKSFAGGLKRYHELAEIIRRYAARPYPASLLFYGWSAYQEALLDIVKRWLPWFSWKWLFRCLDFGRRFSFFILFRVLTKLHFPCCYQDGWVSDQAYFLLPAPADSNTLRVVGSTAHVPEDILPLKIRMYANGQQIDSRLVPTRGEFEFESTLPKFHRSEWIEIELRCNRAFFDNGSADGDQRRIAFELKEVSLNGKTPQRTC